MAAEGRRRACDQHRPRWHGAAPDAGGDGRCPVEDLRLAARFQPKTIPFTSDGWQPAGRRAASTATLTAKVRCSRASASGALPAGKRRGPARGGQGCRRHGNTIGFSQSGWPAHVQQTRSCRWSGGSAPGFRMVTSRADLQAGPARLALRRAAGHLLNTVPWRARGWPPRRTGDRGLS